MYRKQCKDTQKVTIKPKQKSGIWFRGAANTPTCSGAASPCGIPTRNFTDPTDKVSSTGPPNGNSFTRFFQVMMKRKSSQSLSTETTKGKNNNTDTKKIDSIKHKSVPIKERSPRKSKVPSDKSSSPIKSFKDKYTKKYDNEPVDKENHNKRKSSRNQDGGPVTNLKDPKNHHSEKRGPRTHKPQGSVDDMWIMKKTKKPKKKKNEATSDKLSDKKKQKKKKKAFKDKLGTGSLIVPAMSRRSDAQDLLAKRAQDFFKKTTTPIPDTKITSSRSVLKELKEDKAKTIETKKNESDKEDELPKDENEIDDLRDSDNSHNMNNNETDDESDTDTLGLKVQIITFEK